MLNAVLCVWNEADIIEACVRNAFAQGVDNVYLIDNGSTDETVPLALAAGARLAATLDTGFFEEKVKYGAINQVIAEVNRDAGQPFTWWLILDADEFPDTGLGLTLRQFLDRLGQAEPNVNLVPAVLLEHLPTHPPYNLPGLHPIHCQPFADRFGSNKLPLIRYERGKPHITSMGGAHTYHTEDGSYLTGTAHKLVFHHFNYRRPEDVLRRLRLMTEPRPDGSRRIDRMDEYSRKHFGLRSMYWDRLENLGQFYRDNLYRHLFDFPGGGQDVPPGPWPEAALAVPPTLPANLPLWYAPETVSPAGFASPFEHRFWLAGRLLYSGQYERALNQFGELLEKSPAPAKPARQACLRGLELCFRRLGDEEAAALAAGLA